VGISSPEQDVRKRLCYSAGRRPIHGGRGRSSPGGVTSIWAVEFGVVGSGEVLLDPPRMWPAMAVA
jgi:hypothetical protein